ncbi:MAG: transcriptional regulator [Sphingopyxis sp.]|nr:transcriptional regulator [Sphingopyxis sp.]
MEAMQTQRDKVIRFLADRTMARAHEILKEGVTATTLARAVEDGKVLRVARGLYQLPDSQIDPDITLAEISKRIPKGRICMVSALAFHGLTDQMPRKVWIAIGAKDWEPKLEFPRIRIVRFRQPYLDYGVEKHVISGVAVPVYSVVKALADAFRNPKLVDRSVAIESLRSAIEQRKASPSDIAQSAIDCGAWKVMRPYLEAMTHNG